MYNYEELNAISNQIAEEAMFIKYILKESFMNEDTEFGVLKDELKKLERDYLDIRQQMGDL